jgi:hypothetical protein
MTVAGAFMPRIGRRADRTGASPALPPVRRLPVRADRTAEPQRCDIGPGHVVAVMTSPGLVDMGAVACVRRARCHAGASRCLSAGHADDASAPLAHDGHCGNLLADHDDSATLASYQEQAAAIEAP